MANGSANHGALANVEPGAFLEMLYSGKSLRDIAKKLKVSRQAIHAWMLREAGETYHEAITAALVQRVADADERLDTAADAVDIARAREQARFARMDLERRRPGLYGQRPSTAVNINGSGELNVQLVSYAAPATLPASTQAIDTTEQSTE
jgi:transcriptional regulator with XRE-family HTH domain